MQKEITTKISDCFSFQSLHTTFPDSKNSGIQIYEKDDSNTDSKDSGTHFSIKPKDYGTDKTLGRLLQDAFLNSALEEGVIKLSFIDSLFQKSFPRIDEISYYSFSLKKGNRVIDKASYGKKSGFSSIQVDMPLGSKKKYSFSGYFLLRPNAEIRQMLFSIGITSITIILVAILMVYQLVQIRRKTLLLVAREKSVSGVIHDLKSPLAYVFTMLGFFEATEKEPIKKQSLTTAKNRVKFLSEKIESLLSAFKANGGKLKMNLVPYLFSRRCTEIIEELKTTYSGKNITYQVASPSDLTLNVDNTYFEGCIRNLLDNAVKYSSENVEIRVSSEIKENKIVLRFQDNGNGIPENMRKKVFQEFYREKETGEIKGHGVGLSFTRQIVEAHKGKIYIEKATEGKKGTTFVIQLPQTT